MRHVHVHLHVHLHVHVHLHGHPLTCTLACILSRARARAVVHTCVCRYARVVSLQLQRVHVPADFEAAMMSSVITRISVLEAARFKARREVQFRTRAIAAPLCALASVI